MLDFRRGETPEWALEFFQDDAGTMPLDCSGGAIEIIATDLPTTPAIAFEDEAAGIAVMSMTEAETLATTARCRYFVRLRYTSAGGKITIPDDLPIVVKP